MSTNITLQTPEKDIPITVILSNRRTCGIEIKNCNVIVHELAHLKYMNYFKEFWRAVETYYPSYKQCKEELRRSFT